MQLLSTDYERRNLAGRLCYDARAEQKLGGPASYRSSDILVLLVKSPSNLTQRIRLGTLPAQHRCD